MKACLLSVFLISGIVVFGQRKMPAFSFHHNSIEFADANRPFNDENQFSDTLHDERLVIGLTKILNDNPELHIMLIGHTAANEEAGLGMRRAAYLKSRLEEKGIDAARLEVSSKESSEPIIASDIILKLESQVEKEAALQRNRRVEIEVVNSAERQ